MKAFLIVAAIAFAAPAFAGPNSGKTLTLTVPAGGHLRTLAKSAMSHPFYDACGGPVKMRETKSEKLADGSTVWSFVCR